MHVALVLPGFVTLAIYGFVFRLRPALKTAPLAGVQFWTGTIGALAIVIGSFFVTAGSIPVVAAGSLLAMVPSRCSPVSSGSTRSSAYLGGSFCPP